MTKRHLLPLFGAVVLAAGAYLLYAVHSDSDLAVPSPRADLSPARPTGTDPRSGAIAPPAAPRPETEATGGSMPPAVPSQALAGDQDQDRANPSLDAVMDRANKAYDRGDFQEARAIATGVLSKLPNNIRMMRIVVSAACIEGDNAVAQQWFDQLPKPDREQMKIRCDRYGVSFRDPPQ